MSTVRLQYPHQSRLERAISVVGESMVAWSRDRAKDRSERADALRRIQGRLEADRARQGAAWARLLP